ncbi:MAG: protein-L-isoaspartate O-methyltransferase family protein [Steroidobacteraceae bacterium]|jgi:protein-L-isoaspartate(D-aspartate) O-methyltransferase
MSFDVAREQMIQQQLRTWEVLDQGVLEVFERIPRERFVPAGYESLAYADIELPLGQGDHMLAPKIAGRILQAVAIQPADQVLEIGTGSGYLTAGLAASASSVRSLEIRADLAAKASQNLASAGVRNTTVEHRDAYANEALGSTAYDVIVLTGSLPIADERYERQLAIGGRLFAVIGEGAVMEATLIERVSADQYRRTVLFETSLKALIGAAHPARFTF